MFWSAMMAWYWSLDTDEPDFADRAGRVADPGSQRLSCPADQHETNVDDGARMGDGVSGGSRGLHRHRALIPLEAFFHLT